MGDRVTGDRVEKTPRLELDRKDFNAVMVGGVLTDARAPSRYASPAQPAEAAGGGSSAPPFSLTVKEVDADPAVSNVSTIVVPNRSLTDDTGGVVTVIERYPIPIKITAVGGTDANGNALYNVVELDGEGDALATTHANVPNLGRPAATLAVDDQAEMGYSPESDSFFFSEAS